MDALGFDLFVAALRSHDWYYDYSDDYSVWQRGNAKWQAISQQIARCTVCREAYQEYSAFMGNHGPYENLTFEAQDELIKTRLAEIKAKLLVEA